MGNKGSVCTKQKKLRQEKIKQTKKQIASLKKCLQKVKRIGDQYEKELRRQPISDSHGNFGIGLVRRLKLRMEQQHHLVNTDLARNTLSRRIIRLEKRVREVTVPAKEKSKANYGGAELKLTMPPTPPSYSMAEAYGTGVKLEEAIDDLASRTSSKELHGWGAAGGEMKVEEEVEKDKTEWMKIKIDTVKSD